MAIPKLQSVQNDPAELEKCKQDPVYFYNKYIRKEGEPVLDEKTYKELVKKRQKIGQHPPGILDAMTTQMEKYNKATREIQAQINKDTDATTGT